VAKFVWHSVVSIIGAGLRAIDEKRREITLRKKIYGTINLTPTHLQGEGLHNPLLFFFIFLKKCG